MNVGLIGASKIANKIMAQSLNDAGFNIVAVAAASKIRGTKLADTYGADYFNSYHELIKAKKVEAVYISLPNSYHFPIANSSLENKKHVFIEKPLSMSYLETKQLIELAHRNELSVMENFQFQYHRQFEFIKKEISNGLLTDIRAISVRFGFPQFEDKNNIRYKENLGGGAALDAGAYICKIASLLMKGENFKTLSNLSYINDYEVDIYGSCIITEENTNFSVLGSWGFDNDYQCSLEIWSKDCTMIFERIFTAPPGFKQTKK